MSLMASRAVRQRSMARSVSMVMFVAGVGVGLLILRTLPIVDSAMASCWSFMYPKTA